MRVVFLRGYRGKLTGEVYYQAGDVADLPTGEAIVAEGAAEPFRPPKVVRKAAAKPTPKAKPAPRKRTTKPRAK